MHSQTDELIGQWEDVVAGATELCGGLAQAEIWWRATPDSWSVGECLEHLRISVELAIPLLEKALSDGRRRGLLQSGKFRRSRAWQWMTEKMEPPVKTKMKAPGKFRPPPAPRDGASPLKGFVAVHLRLIEVIVGTAGLDLGRIRTSSPVAKVLTASVYDYLWFLAAHARRHLWQARRVTEAPGFPVGCPDS